MKGLNYQKLMRDVIDNRTLNIARATGRISKDNFDRQLKRQKKVEKIVVLPDVTESLPKRSVFLAKAAQDGKLITDTLKDRLTGNLRSALKDFRTVSGEPAFIRRRGKLAGTINPKLISQFEQNIVQTYSSYSRRDPAFGVPANVRQIAITEVRSTVNAMKSAYNEKFARKNPDSIRMTKTWRQNKSLSMIFRIGHSQVHGKKIPIEEVFQVPLYEKKKGVERRIGTTPMKHPHDPSAPLEQIIGCSCDIVYKAVLL